MIYSYNGPELFGSCFVNKKCLVSILSKKANLLLNIIYILRVNMP